MAQASCSPIRLRWEGIATALYHVASQIFAGPVVPAQVQTVEAKLFWDGRSQISS